MPRTFLSVPVSLKPPFVCHCEFQFLRYICSISACHCSIVGISFDCICARNFFSSNAFPAASAAGKPVHAICLFDFAIAFGSTGIPSHRPGCAILPDWSRQICTIYRVIGLYLSSELITERTNMPVPPRAFT